MIVHILGVGLSHPSAKGSHTCGQNSSIFHIIDAETISPSTIRKSNVLPLNGPNPISSDRMAWKAKGNAPFQGPNHLFLTRVEHHLEPHRLQPSDTKLPAL